MFIIILLLVLSFLVIFILKLVSLLMAETVVLSREELSSYECGFEHHSLSRVPFSLRYFFLTLIFLLFDLEIILLLFFPYVSVFSYSYFAFLAVLMFVVFLFLGLLYEWSDGGLEWVM